MNMKASVPLSVRPAPTIFAADFVGILSRAAPTKEQEGVHRHQVVEKRLRALTRISAVLLAFLTVGTTSAIDPIPASDFNWTMHFGASKAAPGSSFVLMASGFLQMPTSADMPRLMANWLHDHPKAVVRTIATFGNAAAKPSGPKMAYVWIVDGEQNLNLELVKQGCFAPETQLIRKGQKLEIPAEEYDAFCHKAIDLGTEAKDKKLGVWKTAGE